MNTVLRVKRKRGMVFDAYYLKAKENDWYFSGTDGQADFERSLQLIDTVRQKYDSAVFLGNSMGAYGALLFGLELEATAILAFSPQTRFDSLFCDQIGEKRWRTEFSRMQAKYDVPALAIRARWPFPCQSRVDVFAGELNRQDMAYCQDLEGLPGFSLTSYPQSGHDLVHDLRATGALEEIIVDTINLTRGESRRAV